MMHSVMEEYKVVILALAHIESVLKVSQDLQEMLVVRDNAVPGNAQLWGRLIKVENRSNQVHVLRILKFKKCF